MEDQNPKQTEESSIGNITEEIEKLKAEKEELSKQQEEHKKQLEELSILKAEVEELKKFKFPEEKPQVPTIKDTIELIKNKFAKLDYAINNFPKGHPERSPFTLKDSYNGQSMLDGYYRYTQGEKVEDIFKNPLE